MALQRPAHPLEPIDGVPDVLDFPRDIQPILDRHCVACHHPDRREGGIDLCGDHTPKYSTAYWTITKHGLVADGRNQPYANRAPRSIGSSASRLMEFLTPAHYGVALSELEHKTIRLWIDTSATYPGTYAALGCGMYPVRLPYQVLVDRCSHCHAGQTKPGQKTPALNLTILQASCNLTRPEKSLVLRAPLPVDEGGLALCGKSGFTGKDDPAYLATLRAIQTAATALQTDKRFDMPGFRPNKFYIREMQRFGILPADLRPDQPIDAYETDRQYWRSFWYRPAMERPGPQPNTS